MAAIDGLKRKATEVAVQYVQSGNTGAMPGKQGSVAGRGCPFWMESSLC